MRTELPDDCRPGGKQVPSPEATGYPFVVSAFGHHDLRPDVPYCHLTATFTDKSLTNVCTASFYFIREWTVVDWCNSGQNDHLQPVDQSG
ncbi:MAG: hypothetical protein IPJ74_01670 [Saprospiraceae bacterium]|nr:hypothetical protein [Saprospiraceae bacterium]